MEKLYTVDDIMERYHVARRTVYKWTNNGKLHPIKYGKRNFFEESDIEAFEQSRKAWQQEHRR